MGESYQFHNDFHHHQNQPPIGSSRLGLRTSAAAGRGGGGEIVEVQGGHIVRSTGRKDRHSKVCTAKGPRDRRVRLSAHTAIQFYDVQDRLGYDRPSKAVDWLIKKAKTAIDELAELPAWKPTNGAAPANPSMASGFEQNPDELGRFEQHPDENMVDGQMGNSQNSSFLPPSLDSDAIADTIKSFFPMGASSNPPSSNNNNNTTNTVTSSGGMQFHHQGFQDLISRSNGGRSQDLRLSLQSFQDPNTILQTHHQSEQAVNNHGLFFDGLSGWQSQPDNPSGGGFQRMVAWGGTGTGDGFVFGMNPNPNPSPPVPFLFGHHHQTTSNNNQLFHNNSSQRGPLQSSNTPSFRAWIDQPPMPPFAGGGMIDHQQPTLAFHHNPTSSMAGYVASGGGFSGFRIPARIQGEDDEEHDGISDKPSSASSDSRH